MRLALALGRTLRELEETLGADEWDLWLRFHAECDLPDGFLTTGVLAATVANLMGGRSKPGDFAPYYREPRPAVPRPGPLAAAFRFLKEVIPHAEQKPQ